LLVYFLLLAIDKPVLEVKFLNNYSETLSLNILIKVLVRFLLSRKLSPMLKRG